MTAQLELASFPVEVDITPASARNVWFSPPSAHLGFTELDAVATFLTVTTYNPFQVPVLSRGLRSCERIKMEYPLGPNDEFQGILSRSCPERHYPYELEISGKNYGRAAYRTFRHFIKEAIAQASEIY